LETGKKFSKARFLKDCNDGKLGRTPGLAWQFETFAIGRRKFKNKILPRIQNLLLLKTTFASGNRLKIACPTTP
jgi:hypothetical protein